jgi:hypothetical protein
MSGYIGPTPVPQATQTRQSFTANANQTSFATLGYEVGHLSVYLNGVKLNSADFTATNSSDIVLAAGCTANDILEMVAFSTFEVTDGAGLLTSIKTVDGATSGLDADLLDGQHGAYYAPIASPALTGNPTAPTQAESDDSTKIATTAYVVDKITTLIGGAPSTLNDLNELAAAINDDSAYNSTLVTALATKMPKSGGAFTGAVTTNSTFDGVDIATRDAVLTATTTTANAALPKTGGAMTGAITTNSTFDGVDIATRDAVLTATTTTANAALPKSGGTMTGALMINQSGNSPQFRMQGNALWDFYSYSDNNFYINNSNGTVLGLLENRDAYFNSNLGIGISTINNTYSSSHALQIASVSDNNWGGTLILSSANGSSVFSRLVNSTNGLDIINHIATPIRFFTGGAERMRISSLGNLLVGTATAGDGVNYGAPGVTTIKGVYGAMVKSTGGSGYEALSLWNTATSGTIYQAIFRDGASGASRGTITTNGSATAYNTSSDYRLKTDAQPMTGATARLKALNPVNFGWIADGTRVDGFLAHEAQEVVPEAVHGTKDAMMDEEYEVSAAIEEVTDDDGNVTTEAADAVMGTRSVPDMQGIDQSKLVPLLVKTIQELEARITALEA